MPRWPVEYRNQLIIGTPESNTAICCFWGNRKRLRDSLDARQYSVIGNLYSRAGINAMLRNILANPRIRYLVLTGKSATDSDEALVSFFQRGVEKDWRIIGNGGQVDRDLPLDVLEEIRRSVRVIDLRDCKNFVAEFQRVTPQLDSMLPFAEPRVFPKTPPTVQSFPNENVAFTVRQGTVIEAWCEVLWMVMNFGRVSSTDYGLEQKELLGLLSVIENPQPEPGKVPDWAPFTAKDVDDYVRSFFEKHLDEQLSYSYGHRLQSYWEEDQLDLLIAELRRSGHSRRALASLWDPIRDGTSSDPPCITTIQAIVRDEKLHLTTFIRSNDMFRAYPLNAFALAELQVKLAAQLQDVGVGSLTILSFSAHVYSDCWDSCRSAMKEFVQVRLPLRQDSRGSFVFEIRDGRLVAEHYSPDGDLIQVFEADDEQSLCDSLAPYVGTVQHGMYLGREINRLASARKRHEDYEQDRA